MNDPFWEAKLALRRRIKPSTEESQSRLLHFGVQEKQLCSFFFMQLFVPLCPPGRCLSGGLESTT